MKDISSTLDYRGQTYKLVFNLNVMEAIQQEYGSFIEWGEKTDGSGKGEPDAKAVIFGFTQMLNEGIDISNDEEGTDLEPLTLKQVGRILTEVGLQNATAKLNKTVVESTKPGEQSKNESSKTKPTQS